MSDTKVDQSSLTRAQAAAAQTGVPQPVTDSAGKIVYYVDYSGAVVPDAIAKDQIARSQSKEQQHKAASKDGLIDGLTGGLANGKVQATQAENNTAAQKLGAANQLKGYVWINGHRASITGFASDGSPIVSYEGGTAQQPQKSNNYQATTLPGSTNSVFSALSGAHPGLDGAPMFNLSTGAADIFTGQTVAGDGFGGATPHYTPAGVGMTGAAAEHSASANVVGADPNNPARNQMTVAQGVQWFLNLSVQHPDVYQHLVDQLVASHYLNPSLGESAGGKYSSDAAAAFAKATSDLAAINTTDGGKDLGLLDFLNQKQQAAQQAAAQAVQPVTRNLQDPATLAYAAKNAAQSAIGRNLTPAEEAAFEKAFRGKENAFYDNVDATNREQAKAGAMNQSGPANTATAPDTTGEAEQYLQQDPQFANQKAGYSMLEYMKAFQNFLGAGHL